MLSESDLAVLFRMNFTLVQYHKYSLTEVENMLPYERDMFIELLAEALKKEEARLAR